MIGYIVIIEVQQIPQFKGVVGIGDPDTFTLRQRQSRIKTFCKSNTFAKMRLL